MIFNQQPPAQSGGGMETLYTVNAVDPHTGDEYLVMVNNDGMPDISDTGQFPAGIPVMTPQGAGMTVYDSESGEEVASVDLLQDIFGVFIMPACDCFISS